MGKLRIVLAKFGWTVSLSKIFGKVWGSKTTENFQVYVERIKDGPIKQQLSISPKASQF